MPDGYGWGTWFGVMSPKEVLNRTFANVLRDGRELPDLMRFAIAFDVPNPADGRDYPETYYDWQRSIIEQATDALLGGSNTNRRGFPTVTSEHDGWKATLGQVYDIRDHKTFLVFEIRRNA